MLRKQKEITLHFRTKDNKHETVKIICLREQIVENTSI